MLESFVRCSRPRFDMDLTLIVPGLAASVARACAGVDALARFARHAGTPSVDRDGLVHATAVALGLADPAASAPVRARGAGLDVADDYVLAADPVSLVAGRDDVRLEGAIDDLDLTDAAALVGALDAHFAADGLVFAAPRPNAWFVRTARAPAIDTTPLDSLIGRPILGALPRGADGGTWQRWQNEIQMLLFTHPVNAAREARDLRPVTGVWFWGGGRGNAAAATPEATLALATDDGFVGDLLRGVARREAQPPSVSPATFAALMPRLAASRALRAVVGLPAIVDDAQLTAFAADWLDPAAQALERGALGALCLVGDGVGVAVGWRAMRPSALARLTGFARRPRLSLPAEAVED